MRTKLQVAAMALLSCIVAVPLSAGQASQSSGQTSSDDARAERRAMRFRAMDANGDGVITRSEWRGNSRAFDRHDINHDGVLSGTEVWPAQDVVGTSGTADSADPESALALSFIRADANRDGIISRDEWIADSSTFARVDVNGDGVITRPEYFGEGWTAGAPYSQEPQSRETRRDSRAYQSGYDRGLADGRQAGKEDKQLRDSWDLEGQRELEQADAGYQASLGAHADYQAGYRTGFRTGYRQGFGPRQ